MRAVGLRSFGPPEVLEVVEVPEPESRPGQAVVAVAAATVNPTDLKFRAGGQAAAMGDLSPPYIPGMELAGRVITVTDGAGALRPGQAVMGVVNPRRPEGGAQAERVLVPEVSLIPLPESCDLVAAATLPMNGLTAVKALEALDLQPGRVLLVTGGAGALGGYVVQLARHRGIRVIADAKPEDRRLLHELGADVVVSRGPAMKAEVRATFPKGVDGLLDAAMLGHGAHSLVRDDGACVSVRGLPVNPDERVRHHAVAVAQAVEDRAALALLSQMIEEEVLTPRVATTLPFERAVDAHRLVERGGLRGRIVLTFDT